jgi:hypothetical protein
MRPRPAGQEFGQLVGLSLGGAGFHVPLAEAAALQQRHPKYRTGLSFTRDRPARSRRAQARH